MKLSYARLCVECEELFAPTKTYTAYGIDMARCPSCGNSATFLLSRIFENLDKHFQELEEAMNGKNTQLD